MLRRFFDSNHRQVQTALKTVDQINKLEEEIQQLDFAQMQQEVAVMREDLAKLKDKLTFEDQISLRTFNRGVGLQGTDKEIHQHILKIMPRFYAIFREVMNRKMQRRHYDIQLAAGVILAQGQKLAEIKTGEGKTQIFFLPTFLYALAGRGAHSVTVNDYLARRDGEYAGHIAAELGMTVGIITPAASYRFIPDSQLKQIKGEDVAAERAKVKGLGLSDMHGLNLAECTKQEAYRCDITFGTNNEFGFDYLRDNMVWNKAEMVQRELYFCTVDEADSVLIDEARTPLIISAPAQGKSNDYAKFARVVGKLVEEKDYVIDYKTRSVTLSEDGLDRAAELLGIDNIWEDYSAAHHLEKALEAKALFIKDDHYIIRDGEVLIVDQFTGRVLPGRRYSDGLHQAIEAKEGVKVQDESKTFATISFQNLFRLYKVLIGGSGTVDTEKEEFFKIYGLDTIVVPTHRNVIREDLNDRVYKNEDAKFMAVAKEVQERNAKGQPVLIGTTSVEKSEKLADLLTQLAVPHQILNAKYHEQEAQIVAKAGDKGAVTVATNMAGRGTDIALTDEVKALGGLAVIGTERHESRRIDNQLRGRSGRQGDPGMSRFYVAMDDMIMKMLGGDMMARLMEVINVPDDQPIEMGMITRRIEDAQRKVEWANFDRRKQLVEYDDVMNRQREIFYTRRFNMLHDYSTNDTATMTKLEQKLVEELTAEFEAVLQEKLASNTKFSSEDVSRAIPAILDVALDADLAKALDVRLGELNTKLTQVLDQRSLTQAMSDLEKAATKLIAIKVAELGTNAAQLYRMVSLEIMNNKWVDHLEHMEDLRDSVRLQGFAQKDPLNEYKTVGFNAFRRFLNDIASTSIKRFMKIKAIAQPAMPTPQLDTNEEAIKDIDTGDREFLPESNSGVRANQLIEQIQRKANQEKQLLQNVGQGKDVKASNTAVAKVGRNDSCPCGSGKKYKKCGLINSAEHQKHMAPK